MTRVRVEPRSFDQGRRKKRRLYPFGHAADSNEIVINGLGMRRINFEKKRISFVLTMHESAEVLFGIPAQK